MVVKPVGLKGAKWRFACDSVASDEAEAPMETEARMEKEDPARNMGGPVE